MLNRYIRIVHSDNGVFTDYSLAGQDSTSTFTLPLVTDEDYIYIGQYYPFNNLFLDIGAANTEASNLQVEIYNNEWVDAVDVLDGTSSSGKSMAKSGVIQWDVDKDNLGWTQVEDPTDDFNASFPKIYDLYWIRISFSASLSAGSTLNQIGYYFATDTDLKAKAPDINDYLTTWASGKTSWTEQILEASKELIDYLKSQGLVASGANILRFDEVNTACAYLALSIIHNGLGGESFEALADREYNKFIGHIKNMPIVIDMNKNAKVDIHQEVNRIHFGKLIR